jgi:hypothetical protein
MQRCCCLHVVLAMPPLPVMRSLLLIGCGGQAVCPGLLTEEPAQCWPCRLATHRTRAVQLLLCWICAVGWWWRPNIMPAASALGT